MENWFFEPLGYNKGFYFVKRGTLLYQITPAGLSEKILKTLAPLEFWGDRFNPLRAADQVLRACERAGVFDSWYLWHDWPDHLTAIPECTVFRPGATIGKVYK